MRLAVHGKLLQLLHNIATAVATAPLYCGVLMCRACLQVRGPRWGVDFASDASFALQPSESQKLLLREQAHETLFCIFFDAARVV